MGFHLEKRMVARINMEECLAWKGQACDACFQACPGKNFGLLMEEWGPVILAPNCKGCDYCVQACQARNGKSFIVMDPSYTPPSGMEDGAISFERLSFQFGEKRRKNPKKRRQKPL